MKANFIIGKKQIILASLVLILGVAVYLNWSFANTNSKLEATNVLENESQSDAIVTDGDVPLDEAEAIVEEVKEKSESVAELPQSKAETKNETKNETKSETKNDTKKTNAVNATAEQTADKDAQSKDKKMGDALLVNAKVVADDTYFAKAKLARTKSRDAAIQTISTILDDEKLTEADKKQANTKALAITDIIEAESRIENLIKAKGFEDCMVYITETNANVVVKTNGLDQNQATQIKNIVVSEGKIKGENVKISEIQ